MPASLSGWVPAAFSATSGTTEDAPACSSTPWRVFVVSWLTGSPASSKHPHVVSDGPQARPCAGAQGKGLGVSKAWAPPARRCCQGGPGTQALVRRPAELGQGAGVGSWGRGAAGQQVGRAGWLSWRWRGWRGKAGRKGHGCVQEQRACVWGGQVPYTPEGQGHPGGCWGTPSLCLCSRAPGCLSGGSEIADSHPSSLCHLGPVT